MEERARLHNAAAAAMLDPAPSHCRYSPVTPNGPSIRDQQEEERNMAETGTQSLGPGTPTRYTTREGQPVTHESLRIETLYKSTVDP